MFASTAQHFVRADARYRGRIGPEIAIRSPVLDSRPASALASRGARYADIGLIVVTTGDADAAQKLFDGDPSVQNGTFQLAIHPFSVIYEGTLGR
jgi:hypothetical protein